MKKLKIILISFVVVLVMLIITISVEMTIFSKEMETNFQSLQERTCKSLFESGYKQYFTGDDKDDTDEPNLEALYGGPLSDEERYDQFVSFITNMNDGVNNATIESEFFGGLLVTDVHMYLDSEMNSIKKDNTLMYARKNSESGSRIRVYYTYQDDALAEQIDTVKQTYGENINSIVFEVDNIYIKDHQFVPDKMYYYAEGNDSDKREITTTAKSEEEMKADGYTLYEIKDEFCLYDIADTISNEEFIIYSDWVDSERQKRVEELFAESQKTKDSEDGYVFLTKKDGLFVSEYFSAQKYEMGEAKDVYYAVTYEKKHIFFDMMSSGLTGGSGGKMLVVIAAEIFFSLVLWVVMSAVIISVTNKKQPKK